MKRTSIGATLCAAVLFKACPAIATPTIEQVFRATLAVHELGDVALSPDGNSVAWQATFNNLQSANETRERIALYVMRIGANAPIRVTAGASSKYYDEENPVWSPDGKHLAFLSDARSTGQLQIFVVDANGANPQQIGKFKGNVQELRWLPNGSALSVLYIENAKRNAGARAPGARDVGVIGSSVEEQRLETIDRATHATRFVTPASDYVYEYD